MESNQKNQRKITSLALELIRVQIRNHQKLQVSVLVLNLTRMLNERNQGYLGLPNIRLEEFNIHMGIALVSLQKQRNEIYQHLVLELITLNLISSTRIKAHYSKANLVHQNLMVFPAQVNISNFLDLQRKEVLHTLLQENLNDLRVL